MVTSPGLARDFGPWMGVKLVALVGDGLEGTLPVVQAALPERGKEGLVLRAQTVAHEHDFKYGGERDLCLREFDKCCT